MVEVRFKPGDVGTVADGAITNIKINASAAIAQSKLDLAITNSEIDAGAAIAKTKLGALEIEDSDVKADAAIVATKLAAIPQSKVTSLETDLGNKVSTGPLTGDKKITAIAWDDATGEIVVDHEA